MSVIVTVTVTNTILYACYKSRDSGPSKLWVLSLLSLATYTALIILPVFTCYYLPVAVDGRVMWGRPLIHSMFPGSHTPADCCTETQHRVSIHCQREDCSTVSSLITV